jgi:DNA-binding MarR family transcriptional regulator
MLITFDNRLERNFIMTIELIKQLLDACYLAKRAREMLPALPEGVTSSYIQCLDVIQKLQTRGIQPKISDLSDTLNLPRPGVTRTVKEMEHKGYLRKQVSAEDGRVTYLFLTESGQALSQKYNTDYFSQLLPYLDGISEEDAACTIQTLEKFYAIMRERKDSLEKRYGLLLATAPVSGQHFRGGCSVHHPNAGKILCYYARKERFS